MNSRQTYYVEHREHEKEQCKAYRATHKEEIKKYRETHRAEINEYHAAYMRARKIDDPEFAERIRAYMREYQRQYRKKQKWNKKGK